MNYLEHHGVKGQRWGIRRFQNKDGTLTPEGIKHIKEKTELIGNNFRPSDKDYVVKDIRDAGIIQGKNYDTIKKGAKIGRLANSGEPIDSKRKYAYLTSNDKNTYSEYYDAIGIDPTLPISTYEYAAKKKLKVKHATDIVDEIVNKYGDATIKQLYNNDLMYAIADTAYKKKKLNKDEKFVEDYSEKGRQWVNETLKDHGNELLSEYKNQGYDAVIDPEDVGSVADYPIILLDPKSSIKLEKESKWF
jgi:hypothetical protein